MKRRAKKDKAYTYTNTGENIPNSKKINIIGHNFRSSEMKRCKHQLIIKMKNKYFSDTLRNKCKNINIFHGRTLEWTRNLDSLAREEVDSSDNIITYSMARRWIRYWDPPRWVQSYEPTNLREVSLTWTHWGGSHLIHWLLWNKDFILHFDWLFRRWVWAWIHLLN